MRGIVRTYYICYMESRLTPAADSSIAAYYNSSSEAVYSVFYLIGGSSNFVNNKIQGRFTWDVAQNHVADLERMGYKAMAVKNGHIIGGYCSACEFETQHKAKEYYDTL